MQTILFHDELTALIRQVEIMEDTEFLDLSGRQLDWMFDIMFHARHNRWHLINDNAVNFFCQIASGKYCV